MFQVGDEQLNHGTDLGILPMNNGNKNVSGGMVFVAYGIVADAIKRNDLKGIDVSGKIVVMLDGPPAKYSERSVGKTKSVVYFSPDAGSERRGGTCHHRTRARTKFA